MQLQRWPLQPVILIPAPRKDQSKVPYASPIWGKCGPTRILCFSAYCASTPAMKRVLVYSFYVCTALAYTHSRKYCVCFKRKILILLMHPCTRTEYYACVKLWTSRLECQFYIHYKSAPAVATNTKHVYHRYSAYKFAITYCVLAHSSAEKETRQV